uniref:Putative RNA-dependent RNA polymerase n=1 Tax=Dromedary picobirnavirus TaxID=1574421 RepID=A0A0A1EJC0_9VIRU|nr:putative RNA-dependent RNA polymerase [Dromedary picobirnavirus]
MRARDTLVTNSGWDLFTRREKAKGKAIQDAKDGKAWLYPAIILFRKYNGKLRVVWMYPMSMNLLEYQATQPLQEVIQSHTSYVMPWRGFEHVKRRFTELWAAHPYAFGGDTTAMDAHMQAPQNEAVAAAFSPLFKDPKQATDSLLHVNDIDIVVGRNSVIADQQHGVASGSGWTQLCETIFQIIKFDEWIQRNNLSITIEDGMGIGDDYVWFFDEKPDSQEIVDFWAEDGLPGKEEKQSNEPDSCTFLQRLFIKNYMSREDDKILGGIYPTVRALNSLLWPEKFHNPKNWNSDMFCTRCYMILENTVDHPFAHVPQI